MTFPQFVVRVAFTVGTMIIVHKQLNKRFPLKDIPNA